MSEKFYRMFDNVGDLLEQHSRAAAIALLALIFLFALGQAAGKPFGYDEIYTWLPASLPTWSGVWSFFAQGADTPSPLPALLVHATLRFPSDPEIVTRIPFMLAFLAMCLGIFVFVRRRYSTGYALAALSAPVALPFFFFYSTEDRAYALVLAGTGLALVCWQSLASNAVRGAAAALSAFGLWLGLAFAICAHSFAIFLFVPFALAQLAADFEKKKLNLPAWLALLLFPLGLLPVLHGEMLASHAYRATFFFKPSMHLLPQTYGVFFEPGAVCGTILLFAILVLVMRGQSARYQSTAVLRSGFTRPELVFAVALAFMPFYALPASMLLGVYRPPYVLSTLIGIVLCVIAALAELSRREAAFGVALFAALFLSVCARTAPRLHLHELTHLQRVHADDVRTYNQQDWVQIVASSSLPVAIADPDLYMNSRFYWPASEQQRLWHPTNMALASTYPDSVTIQINLLRAEKYVFLPSMDWAEFSARYPHFLLVTQSPQATWLPSYLKNQPPGSVKISPLGPDFESGSPNVYDIHLAHAAAPQSSSQ